MWYWILTTLFVCGWIAAIVALRDRWRAWACLQLLASLTVLDPRPPAWRWTWLWMPLEMCAMVAALLICWRPAWLVAGTLINAAFLIGWAPESEGLVREFCLAREWAWASIAVSVTAYSIVLLLRRAPVTMGRGDYPRLVILAAYAWLVALTTLHGATGHAWFDARACYRAGALLCCAAWALTPRPYRRGRLP